MTLAAHKITPCLWFDTQAEDAAKFYVSIFKNSKIGNVSRYSRKARRSTASAPGTVMTVEFELDGQPFIALNGGPQFKFNEAISFQVDCETQDEVDYYWSKLSRGRRGRPLRLAEGQVRPVVAGRPDRGEMLPTRTPRAQRVTEALLQMKKFDIAALERAFDGQGLRRRRSQHSKEKRNGNTSMALSLPVPKKNLEAYCNGAGTPARSGRTTARWNTSSASPMTSSRASGRRFRAA